MASSQDARAKFRASYRVMVQRPSAALSPGRATLPARTARPAWSSTSTGTVQDDGFEVGCAAARREEARTVAIEAELKARVTDPEMVLRALAAMAPSTSAIYWDRYFDSEDGSFTASGRELRIRTVDCAEAVRHILTFKAPAVDAESGSKPEYETVVADPEATAAILLALGYRALVSFSKHCANHRIRRANRDMLATVVTVPEIDGTFLEVETLTDDVSDVPAALMAVRAVMVEVGIVPRDFTTELYTDAVLRARPGSAV